MFLCEVCEKFSVGHTKMSYIVWHGLSEVLLNELVDDIKASIGTVIYIINATFWYATGAKVKTMLAQDI